MGIPDRTVEPLGNGDVIAAHDFQLATQILDEFKDSDPIDYDIDWAHGLIYRALQIGRKERSEEELHQPESMGSSVAGALTGYDIGMIISGVMGSFVSWCEVDAILEGLDNIYKQREEIRSHFKLMKRLAVDAERGETPR